MPNRRIPPIAIAGVAIVLHGAVAVAVIASPQLQHWLFGGSRTLEFGPRPDRLAIIVDGLRETTRDRWQERLTLIHRDLAEVEAARDRLLAQIRDNARGPDYHRELLRLLGTRHAPVQQLTASDSKIDPGSIYDHAVTAEQRLTNAYIDVIAATAALGTELPPIDAVAHAKVVPPVRPSLDNRALLAEIRRQHDGQLDRFKSAVIAGGGQLDAMVRYSEKIAQMVREGVLDARDDGFLAILDDARAGSRGGDTLRPDQVRLDDYESSDGGFGAQPGRVIGVDATASPPIFVDRWYVIGPFENRLRSNMDASFLPETVIDLDHVTVGKGGRELSWEYWRRSTIRIEPAYAEQGSVYYAWSQVWAPAAGSYLFSTGSDDYGKLWINGELVWNSGTEPKSFRANEHTGEVVLRQGSNEILFRCENGGGTMGWTVVFHGRDDDVE